MRIVSLIASATEIVCALGRGRDLVGRSHECDYPESITRLPACTAPKFNVQGTSGAIDQRVREILQQATSVYRVDADLLRELKPDIIITQTQCAVCAVSKRDVDEGVCAWVDKPVQIIAAPGVYAAITASTGTAVVVRKADLSAVEGKVVLRGLTLNSLGAERGVSGAATSLHVENCIINGFRTGLEFGSADGTLFIKDTVVRNGPGLSAGRRQPPSTLPARLSRSSAEHGSFPAAVTQC